MEKEGKQVAVTLIMVVTVVAAAAAAVAAAVMLQATGEAEMCTTVCSTMWCCKAVRGCGCW